MLADISGVRRLRSYSWNSGVFESMVVSDYLGGIARAARVTP